ncbi:MAG: GTPase [Candidatus Brocadiia bacterium]
MTQTTVAAILTPLGRGGIAVLGVAGPQAHQQAREVFRPKRPLPRTLDGSRLHYGHIVQDDEVLDEVLVRFLSPSERADGQPAVEVNCHGGVVAVQRVLACFTRRGARAVESEDFLARAARSRIEAEAAQALLAAPTELGAEILLDQLAGALEGALERLPTDRPQALAAALRELLATERFGRALWQPPVVTLVGPTNAGKSTLFNALAREERMIVSPQPGTTRDTVGAEVAIGGVPVWLADTAGQREPASELEAAAIGRARGAAAAADLALLVLDGSVPLPVPLEALRQAVAAPGLAVVNKSDLALASWSRDATDAVVVSAVTGRGLDELARRISAALVGEARQPGRPVVFTERQADALRAALGAAEAGDLQEARRHLGKARGGEPQTA